MSNLNNGGLTRVLNYIKTWVNGLLSGKSDTSHTHTKSQITDFPSIPSKTSQLTNDSGFLTAHQSLSNYSTLANTVKSLSISGKTITVTPGSGSAYTLTTQDTVYTHPTTAGNKHVPSGGSSGQFLGWDSAGTAKWVNNPNSDTKNTAGSTDTSSKIFLIGATSQAANPQTYSHDTAYVGTDGCLYSGGTKVLTAHQSLSNYLTKTAIVSEMGRYIDMHYDNATATYDFDVRLQVNSQGTAAGGGVLQIVGASVKASKFEGPLTGNVTGNCSGSSGSCTGNAATASKLATARSISAGDLEFQGSANFDGSGNIKLNITHHRSLVTIGNTNNYPFHRIAYTAQETGNWLDRVITFFIGREYSGGGYGICRIVLRTNDAAGGATASCVVEWLVRTSSIPVDAIQVGFNNTAAASYVDVFYKSSGSYSSAICRVISHASSRTSVGQGFAVVSTSSEVNNTTTSDPLTSTESYATIAAAGTKIRGKAYTSTITASDAGIVNYATYNANGKELVNSIIKGLSVSGRTITYTKIDGTTGTLTTQDTNTTYSNFVKSGSGAKAGLVPAPSTTAGTTKYLREDGTWQVPPDHTYTVNNATLTIQKNGTTVKTFTANASSNVTANITVPTKTSELTNNSGFISSAIKEGSIESSGWCLLYGDLLIQWGTAVFNGQGTVNFSKPFLERPFVVMNYGDTSAYDSPCAIANGQTTNTYFSARQYNLRGGWRCNWIAVGKKGY